MFKLYDTAFKIGFGLTVLVFVILNIISYLKVVGWTLDNKFSGDVTLHGSPLWGFPIEMNVLLGLVINFLIIAFCSFLVGLIFRFIWSKFQEKSLK